MIKLAIALLFAGFGLPALANPPSPAPGIAAKYYLLVDFQSRQALAEQNSRERVEPASLTKLMTAYLSFKALKDKRLSPGQILPVSEKAWKAEGSRMFLEPGKPATVDELLKGMIVQSGNDACIVLAEAIVGTEEAFAGLMNREAQRLGMSDTHFVNATGLPDPRHYSTARDLSLLAMAIIQDFPEYFPLYSIKEYTYNNVSQPNRNRLLWADSFVDGMKTGYTENAGYCLIATAKRGERRLLSVVLGTSSDAERAAESQKLLNFGFQQFETVRLFAKGQTATVLPIWKGVGNSLKAGFLEDLYVSLPKGQSSKLKATLETRQPLIAPVQQGQPVGALKLTLGSRPLVEFPVVALESISIAGLLGRGWDSLRLLFR